MQRPITALALALAAVLTLAGCANDNTTTSTLEF